MRVVPCLLCVGVLLGAAGCGGDGGAGGGDRARVVATTGILADVVGEVAGDAVEVVQLVPDSADPHSYSASARDRATLEAAALVVAVGRDYERSLPLGGLDAPVFRLADHVGARGAAEDEHAADEEHAGEDDHGHAGRDPHVWMDPTLVASALHDLVRRLAAVAPAHADGFRARARSYAQELRSLDAELRRALAGIPDDRRKLVTSHESLGYFAARYDLEVVAAPFGLAPEAEASAERVADVIRVVRRERVPAVFAQEGDDPEVMRRIAEETGVRIVDDLLVENPGPQARTYTALLRHDARRIADALGR